MKIYEALKKDHDEVKALLTKLISLDDKDTEGRQSLITQIRDALIPHSRAEEAVFYNSLRAMGEERSEVMHGYAEHVAAEGLLRSLQVTGQVNLGWRTTAESLKKALEHHIQEEETELFAAGRAVFSEEEAEQIGAAFESLKPKYREESLFETSVDLMKNLMPPRFATKMKDMGSSKSVQ